MISDEKVSHVVHLILDGLQKEGFWDAKDRGKAVQEAKKACFSYVNQLKKAEETAIARIKSQKSPPPERSPQWDTLYSKYLDEELKKLGG